MTLELVPKSELPEWDKEDDKRMNEFITKMESGTLQLIKFENPINLN